MSSHSSTLSELGSSKPGLWSSGGTWPFYHWKTEMSRPEIEWPSCSLMIHHISIFNSEEIRKWWSFGDRIFIPRGLASESVWKPERIISSGKQSQKVCSPSCFTNLSRRKPLILICERSLEKVHNTFQQNCGMLQGKRMMWSKYRFKAATWCWFSCTFRWCCWEDENKSKSKRLSWAIARKLEYHFGTTNLGDHLSHSNHPTFGQESWATAFEKCPIIVHTSWKSLEIRRSNCLNLFYYIIASSSTNPPKELVQENMDQCQNPSWENWNFKTKWWVGCFDHHFSASLRWKKTRNPLQHSAWIRISPKPPPV